MKTRTRTALIASAALSTALITVPAYAATPAAVTGTASAITQTGATVAGTVNPNGENTSYHFDYGTTTTYGSTTATGTINGAGTPATISRGSVSGTDYVKAEISTGTSVSVTKPTADTTGTVLVADVTTAGTGQTLPTGWTWATGFPDVQTNVTKGLAWHAGSSSDPASWSFTQSATGKMTVIVTVYSGVDTASPFDGTPTKATAIAASVAVPSITTTVNGDRLITGAGADCSTTCTLTKPSTSTLLVASAGTGKRSAFADEAQTTAGATGTRTWTDSVSNLRVSAYLAALKPATSGGITTAQNVSANLTGLTAGTTYHYRLVASNGSGTSTGADATFTTTAPGLTWTTVAGPYDFTDGVFPAAFYQYDGRLGSTPNTCVRPSHAAVVNGALRLLLSYESSGTGTGTPACGAEWYGGAVQSRTAYSAPRQAVEFDAQLVVNGATVQGWQNWVIAWKDGVPDWYNYEWDACEGRKTTECTSYIHHDDSTQVVTGGPFLYDKTAWHHFRMERLAPDHTVNIFRDGTLIYTYTGPEVKYDPAAPVVPNWVFQLERPWESTYDPQLNGTATTETLSMLYDNVKLQTAP